MGSMLRVNLEGFIGNIPNDNGPQNLATNNALRIQHAAESQRVQIEFATMDCDRVIASFKKEQLS